MYTGQRGPLEEFLLEWLVRVLYVLSTPFQWYNRLLERIGLYQPNRRLRAMTVSQLVALHRAGGGGDDAAAGEFRRRGVLARDELIQLLDRVRIHKTSRDGHPTSVSGRTMAIAGILLWHFPCEDSYQAVERLRRCVTDADTQEVLAGHLADMRATLLGHLNPEVMREWMNTGSLASCLAQADMRLTHAEPAHRLYLMQSLPRVAIEIGDLDRAEAYARELLAIPDLAEKSGDGVHCANYALGVLALTRDDGAAAVQYMLRSANTRGSARLSGVGPEMSLAAALLAGGEQEAVLEYLERCRSFWKCEDGAIDRWQNTIRAGRVPNFHRPRM
jgi:hypothetical protein